MAAKWAYEAIRAARDYVLRKLSDAERQQLEAIAQREYRRVSQLIVYWLYQEYGERDLESLVRRWREAARANLRTPNAEALRIVRERLR